MQTLDEIIHQQLNRRSALTRLSVAATTAVTATTVAPVAASNKSDAIDDYKSLPHLNIRNAKGRKVAREPAVADGYQSQVLVRWGDPVVPGAPNFDVNKQTPQAQAGQFGHGNDYVGYFPLPLGSKNSAHGLLCVNHEHTKVELMFPGLTKKNKEVRQLSTREIQVDMEAHGVGIHEVKRIDGQWQLIKGGFNRRYTTSSRFILSGPVAGTPRVCTDADPLGRTVIGTFANCAGGVTPWGTLLSAEENFQYHFQRRRQTGGAEEGNLTEYGVGAGSRSWYRVDQRFNVDLHPTEPNRFGWVVEIDPYDPKSVPKKRTALGRFNHEGASTSVSQDGRIVVYMGDDNPYECLFKFVSKRAYIPNNRRANRDLLDEGTLYVARFNANGKVRWLPLVYGQGPLTSENGFFNQADVFIEARRAAKLLGGTPMDRPEDVEENQKTGNVFVMMTNNKSRKDDEVEPANPRANNAHGHIIELLIPQTSKGRNHAALEHGWSLFVKGGSPQKDGWYQGQKPTEWISCPDNCAFDSAGRLWITTDGASSAGGFVDGIYCCETTGPRRALTKQFFRAPVGAEICGPAFTPDNSTLFLAIQHPGSGSDFADPSTRWPNAQDSKLPPMPAVVAITRK